MPSSVSPTSPRSPRKRSFQPNAEAKRRAGNLLADAARLPLERLLATLPRFVGELLPAAGPGAIKPILRTLSCATVFVDVSGFTAIGYALQRFTTEGAEALSFHLNEYFAKLLSVVRNAGGDVVSFSGDAMMLMWPGSPEQATVSATACAVQLLMGAGQYAFTIPTDQQGTGPLQCEFSVHIGVACGEVTAMVVGGNGDVEHGRWRYLVVGPPVEACANAANVAIIGELGLSQSATDALSKAGCSFTTRDPLPERNADDQPGGPYVLFGAWTKRPNVLPVAPARRPEGTTQLKQSAASFIFDTVVYALLGSVQGELRTVSTVFIKVLLPGGAQLSADEVHEKLNSAVRITQRQLTKCDGILNKVAMDDKGIIFLCLLGVPHHSHADDTCRAVTFAVDLAHKLGKEGMITAIGISRARVYCGVTGDTWRQEYTVLGDGVNVAARLMSLAASFTLGRFSGAICDQETARAVEPLRHNATVQGGAEIVLKGRANPVACFYIVAKALRDQFRERYAEHTGLPPPLLPDEEFGSDSDSDGGQSLTSGRASRASRSSLASFTSMGSFRAGSAGLQCLSSPVSAGSPGRQSLSPGARGARPHRGGGRLAKSPSTFAPDALPPQAIGRSGSRASGVGSGSRSPRGSDRGSIKATSPRQQKRQSLSDMMESHAPAGGDAEEDGPFAMVGRDGEKAVVQSWLSTAPRRTEGPAEGRVLYITGDAQSGKTLLLLYAATCCQRMGYTAVCVEGAETAAKVKYSALRLTVERSARPPLPQGISALHYVSRLRGVLAPTEAERKLPPQEKVAAANAAAMKLLFPNLHGQTAVLLVDNLQWVDGCTMSFLAYAAGRGVTLVAAHRIGASAILSTQLLDAPATPSSGASSGGEHLSTPLTIDADQAQFARELKELLPRASCTVNLAPVGPHVLSAAVAHALQAEDLHPTLLELLARKSEGSCGLAVQMAQALKQAGCIEERRNGLLDIRADVSDARLEEQLAHSVPFLEAAVMQMVDRLSMYHRRVLSTASALGVRFSPAVLSRCLELDPDPGTGEHDDGSAAVGLVGVLSGLALLGVIAPPSGEKLTRQQSAAVTFVRAFCPDASACADTNTAFTDEELSETFARFDTDGDLHVDVQEIAAGLAGMGFGRQTPLDAERIMMCIDDDENGFMDYAEFCTKMRAPTVGFVCPIARDVIYYATLGRDRRRLHCVLADVLQEQKDIPPEVLAHHLLLGKQPGKARAYQVMAYRRSMEAGLMLAADRYLGSFLSAPFDATANAASGTSPTAKAAAILTPPDASLAGSPQSPTLPPVAPPAPAELARWEVDHAHVLLALGRLRDARARLEDTLPRVRECLSGARRPSSRRQKRPRRRRGCCCCIQEEDSSSGPEAGEVTDAVLLADALSLRAELAVLQGDAAELPAVAAEAAAAAAGLGLDAAHVAELAAAAGGADSAPWSDPRPEHRQAREQARHAAPWARPPPAEGLGAVSVSAALQRPLGAFTLLAHPQAGELPLLLPDALPTAPRPPCVLSASAGARRRRSRGEKGKGSAAAGSYAVPPEQCDWPDGQLSAPRAPTLHALHSGLCAMRLLSGSPKLAEQHRRALLHSALASGDMRAAAHACALAVAARALYDAPPGRTAAAAAGELTVTGIDSADPLLPSAPQSAAQLVSDASEISTLSHVADRPAVWGKGADIAAVQLSFAETADAGLESLYRACAAVAAADHHQRAIMETSVFGGVDEAGFHAAEAEAEMALAVAAAQVASPMHCLALAYLTYGVLGPDSPCSLESQRSVSTALRRGAEVYPWALPAAEFAEALVAQVEGNGPVARAHLRAAAQLAGPDPEAPCPFAVRAQCHLCADRSAPPDDIALLRKLVRHPTVAEFGASKGDMREEVASDLRHTLRLTKIGAPLELQLLGSL
eukprot:TRINITY_DN3663_c0_g1_i1.p1 TRINITY_DN3663_c0_g1~~TRINITY_DN3663_c0_g1_i1.p1  ORF type:complete len:1901 (+),score=469.07 TRINITY_DN3663_c0_g1_i1:175-5877(+)